jgi:hypothetical protein
MVDTVQPPRLPKFQKPIGVVATKKMQLLRWNNTRPQGPQGERAEPSAAHSGQGLEVRKRFSLPVEGEIFSLTFPFIDQAITPPENCW